MSHFVTIYENCLTKGFDPNARENQKSHSFRELISYIALAFSDDGWKKKHRIHDYNGMNSFKQFIVAYTMEISEKIVRANRDGKGFTPEEWFQMTILCHGISHISEILMKKQFPENRNVQIDILFSMLPDTIKDYQVCGDENRDGFEGILSGVGEPENCLSVRSCSIW